MSRPRASLTYLRFGALRALLWMNAVYYDVSRLIAYPTFQREAYLLVGLCVATFALGYFDVRHKEIFGTTHITGTWLHYGLRHVGYYVLLRLAGCATQGDAAFVAVAYAAPSVHAALSYVAGRAMRLDERDAPPSTGECLVGLAASYAVMGATLCTL